MNKGRGNFGTKHFDPQLTIISYYKKPQISNISKIKINYFLDNKLFIF